jgi:hypothetical protein
MQTIDASLVFTPISDRKQGEQEFHVLDAGLRAATSMNA